MPQAPSSCPRLFLLALLLVAGARAHALDSNRNTGLDLDDTEIEEKYITRVQEEAAKYRLERTHWVVDAAYDRAGAAYLEQARAVLADGKPQSLERSVHWLSPHWWLMDPPPHWRACWLAGDGFADYPFSSSAGELLATQMECYAKRGAIQDLHDTLFKLWFYRPDYPDFQRVMQIALEAGERVQDFSAAVHLEANDPAQVIRISGSWTLNEVKKLFRFLVLHGDRDTVAPRAAIGLARAELRSGDKDDLFQARREYERFCETYPTNELVFQALCERALSYLVAYRGESYDVGVLVSAEVIIDQAEIESRSRPENVKQVEAYRKRIRAWRQDRDLEVARWYRDRVLPGLAWVTCPGDINATWNTAARFYYSEVISRDSSSDQARAARRERESLPPATPAELGTELRAPPPAAKP